MRNIIVSSLVLLAFTLSIQAQNHNRVVIERFTETGCGACATNDSAFNALMKNNAQKVAVINYHCYYTLDTFYTYNKVGYDRYAYYKVKGGFPSAAINGQKPHPAAWHIAYLKQPLVDTVYNRPPQFSFEISTKSTGKAGAHSADMTVKATSLKDNPSENLRLFVVVTENNINHLERYGKKSVNGVNEFNHIMRAMLPDTGNVIGAQKAGKVNKVKVSLTNDDREIKFNEVRLVVFVQDYDTREILGAITTEDHPFK